MNKRYRKVWTLFGLMALVLGLVVVSQVSAQLISGNLVGTVLDKNLVQTIRLRGIERSRLRETIQMFDFRDDEEEQRAALAIAEVSGEDETDDDAVEQSPAAKGSDRDRIDLTVVGPEGIARPPPAVRRACGALHPAGNTGGPPVGEATDHSEPPRAG